MDEQKYKYKEVMEFAILMDQKPNLELASQSMTEAAAAGNFGPVGGNIQTMSKQPDLQYLKFVMASEGTNRNGFIFSREDLIGAFDSAKMKPINMNHSYMVCGHIYDAGIRGSNNKVSTSSNSVEDSSLDSPLDLIAAGVVYKEMFPDISDKVYASTITHDWAMSMECFMEDCVYICGDNTITSEDDNFYIYTEAYRSKSKIENKPVYRKPINPVFGGVGIVEVPAESRAQIAEAAEFASKHLCDEAKETQKPYGDVTYADPKNNKYPIDTEEHIRAAWSYINVPKNQEGYTPAQVKTIKGHIVNAWKKVIDKNGPPGADKASLEVSEVLDGIAALSKVSHPEGGGAPEKIVNLDENANDKEVFEMELTKEQIADMIKKELANAKESEKLTNMIDENAKLKVEVADAQKAVVNETAKVAEAQGKVTEALGKVTELEGKIKESEEKASNLVDKATVDAEWADKITAAEEAKTAAETAKEEAVKRAEEAEAKLADIEAKAKIAGRQEELSNAGVLFPEESREKQMISVASMDDTTFVSYLETLVTVKEMAAPAAPPMKPGHDPNCKDPNCKGECKTNAKCGGKSKAEEEETETPPAPVIDNESAETASVIANASTIISAAKASGIGFFAKVKTN